MRSRREAALILASWVLFLFWTVGFCALRGYGREAASLQTVLGMPDWVFWGVVLPWICATFFSIWFGLLVMRDEPRRSGEKSDEHDPDGRRTDSAEGREG